MINRLKNHLARFRKEERGSTNLLEFVIMVPVLVGTLGFGVELTTHSNRQFQLDRGLEVTTRVIRLGTGTGLTHDIIKQAICDNAGGLDDCEEKLRLEMIPVNPREFVGLSSTPDCTNAPQPVNPVRGWTLGQQHELMLLRACYQYTPFLADIGLGRALAADGTAHMVAISAFVQEPR